MPVPKRKLSRKRRDQRSANKHLVPQGFQICTTPGCEKAIMRHRACYHCGMYKGEKIFAVKSRLAAQPTV